ncbi:MAG: hypothetical protein ACLQVD_16865 [Capsulimonadaceae bacterium]
MAHFVATVLDDRRLELPQGVLSLISPGQQVEIDFEVRPASRAVGQNEAMLAALDRLAEMSRDMPFSDGSDTMRLIHEAQDGAMYGD